MKRIRKFSIGSVLGAAVIAAGLATAPASAQEAISDEHLAAARELVTATKTMATFDDILPLLAEQTRTIFIQSDPALSSIIGEVVTDVAISMAPQRRDLNKTIYEVWARRFSIEELQMLTEFYKTPAGSKLAELGPSITALTIGAARQWQDKLSTEMVSLVREELDKRNAKTTE